MAVTVADFRVRFPEFEDDITYPDARIQIFIDDATLCVLENIFGNLTDIATCYLAAHYLYLATKSSTGDATTASPLSSKTADKLSLSKAVSSVDATDPNSVLSSSQYGQRYLQYFNKVRPFGPIVTKPKCCYANYQRQY